MGKRVQAVYASIEGQPSRYGSMASGIRKTMALIDARFDDSAKKTGGHRSVRWVVNYDCTSSIQAVTISVAALTEEGQYHTKFRSDLASQGYSDPNRKYLVWIDPGALDAGCSGWADVNYDDRPTLNNRNNAGDYPYPFYATATLCSAYPTPEQTEGLAAHELMHSLGAVQKSAPHSDGWGHCTDGYDTLCHNYSYPCTNLQVDVRLFDCGNDDYFYAGKPPGGNYLATHWNTADSSFLINPDWPG